MNRTNLRGISRLAVVAMPFVLGAAEPTSRPVANSVESRPTTKPTDREALAELDRFIISGGYDAYQSCVNSLEATSKLTEKPDVSLEDFTDSVYRLSNAFRAIETDKRFQGSLAESMRSFVSFAVDDLRDSVRVWKRELQYRQEAERNPRFKELADDYRRLRRLQWNNARSFVEVTSGFAYGPKRGTGQPPTTASSSTPPETIRDR